MPEASEKLCRVCGYRLDYLPELRCPECGTLYHPSEYHNDVAKGALLPTLRRLLPFVTPFVANIFVPTSRPPIGHGSIYAGLISVLGLMIAVCDAVRGPRDWYRAVAILGGIANVLVLWLAVSG
jgi:hypothetical protein